MKKKGEFDSLTEEKDDSLSSNEIVKKENSINKNDSDDDDNYYNNNKKNIRIPTKNEKAMEKNNKKNKNVSKKDNNTYKNNKKNQYSIICSNNNFNLDKKYIKIDYFFEEFEKKLYIEDIDYDKFHCEYKLKLRKKI